MAGTAIMVRGGISVGHNLLLKDSREWNERRWIQRNFYECAKGSSPFNACEPFLRLTLCDLMICFDI